MNAIQVYGILKKKLNGLASGVKSATVNGTTMTFVFNNGTTSSMTFPTPSNGEDGLDITGVEINSDNTITCTLSDGSTVTSTNSIKVLNGKDGLTGKDGVNGKDGISITNIEVNTDNTITSTLSDGNKITSTNKITVKDGVDGVDGVDGYSPTIAEDIANTDDVYKLVITNEKTSFTTPNLMGKGSNDTFDRTDLTAVTVGGLNVGSSVKDKTTKEVLESILFPYQKPTVNFSISPSTLSYQSGDTISSLEFTVNATKKSENIQSIKIYDGSTLLTTITSNVANGGTFKYTYTCNIAANTTLKVEVSDGTSTVSATKAITFANKSYYGFVADGTIIDEAVIKGLQNSVVKTSKALTYNGITCEDSKIVYAYPQNQGLLSSILDGSGFDYIGDYTCETIVVDGVNYNVYTLSESITLDNFKQVFA